MTGHLFPPGNFKSNNLARCHRTSDDDLAYMVARLGNELLSLFNQLRQIQLKQLRIKADQTLYENKVKKVEEVREALQNIVNTFFPADCNAHEIAEYVTESIH